MRFRQHISGNRSGMSAALALCVALVTPAYADTSLQTVTDLCADIDLPASEAVAALEEAGFNVLAPEDLASDQPGGVRIASLQALLLGHRQAARRDGYEELSILRRAAELYPEIRAESFEDIWGEPLSANGAFGTVALIDAQDTALVYNRFSRAGTDLVTSSRDRIVVTCSVAFSRSIDDMDQTVPTAATTWQRIPNPLEGLVDVRGAAGEVSYSGGTVPVDQRLVILTMPWSPGSAPLDPPISAYMIQTTLFQQ